MRLLESRGYEVEKHNVQRLGRDELAGLASLFRTDAEMVANLVHERKREAVAGLSRDEILDRMALDYTYINRPVAVRGRSIACGSLRLNGARYDALFGGQAG